jgi:hypothetical protein
MLGQVASMTPDYAKAKQAAERVFYLLDKVPHIDVYSSEGIKPVRKVAIQTLEQRIPRIRVFRKFIAAQRVTFA